MPETINTAKKRESGKKPLRFIFITPFSDIPFFETVKKGMNDAAKQLNVSCEFTGTQHALARYLGVTPVGLNRIIARVRSALASSCFIAANVLNK